MPMTIFGDPLIPSIEYSGTAYGSAFLKSLQTEKLPELDLLVRESVQNSSDAAIGIDHKNFWIDYTFSEFDPSGLYEAMSGIGQPLRKKYGEGKQCFLEIRDSKTSGLTGPYDKEDLADADHGNYFKLIFDSGINQTQQGAGGNWGFGKSVYYRVSDAGLVIFYTRIADGGEGVPEERLIATMVENESSPGSILRGIVKNPTGRAWWGRPGTEKGVVWPVTDHDEIKRFLSIFGLTPFAMTETGTSVIIPFVDEKELLEDIIPNDGASEDEIARCVWSKSVPSYLGHALQKWYAPRLRNKELEKLKDGSKWIRARVNGSLLKNDKEMNPVFKLVQELYNVALFKCRGKSYVSDVTSIKCKDVDIRREGLARTNVGCVAYVKLTNRDIFGARAGISPYILTGNFKNSDDENEPIVMFAREPGMVISYSIDGTWSNKVKAPCKNAGSSDDEYIFAFYVPRVDNEFEEDAPDNRRGIYGDLGGYLRKCEESDHASWEDKAKFKLISKIKNGTARKIAEGTREDDMSTVSASASRLSGRIGKALMPERGALAKPTKPRSGSGGSGSGRGEKPTFVTGDPRWSDGALAVPFEMGMGDKKSRQIRVEIQTEGGTLSSEAWAKEIGTRFPVEIVQASAEIRKSDGTSVAVSCAEPACENMNSPLAASLLVKGEAPTVFSVGCEVPGQLITGEISLKSLDKTIECVVKAI